MLIVPMFALLLIGAGCKGDSFIEPSAEPTEIQPSAEESMTEPKPGEFPGVIAEAERLNKQVRMMTDKGEIVFELYGDTAPKAVSNFITLTNNGYFNGLTFHRRVEGFVIQGGDPDGNGTGGPGYTFEDELSDNYTYERGVVAMANRGPDTNGSQFFIMLADYPLPKSYTIFGRVTSGLEAVDAIQVGDKMTTVAIEAKP